MARRQGNKKQFRGNKGRKPNPKFRDDRVDEKEEDGRYKHNPFNDFSWYDRNPALIEATAKLPFPYRPGMSVSMAGKYTKSTKIFRPFDTPIPGVLALSWAPTVGNSSTPTDPASIAAKEIFGKVREAYSGSLDADPPDFVIYLYALDSIFSYIGSLKRIFRGLTTYSPDNLNLPNLVLQSLGLSQAAVEQLKVRKMELYQVINELVGMLGKFKCPAIFPMFNRHYWLNDNVYTDAETPNSQLYAFVQAGFYKYTLLKTPDDVDAGGLRMVAAPTYSTAAGSKTVPQQMYEFGRSLIDALAASDDAYIISGYLTRAFEGVENFIVEPITLGEQFMSLYVPEVLSQIENTVALDLSDLTLLNISQDPKTNSIISDLTYTAALGATAPYLTPALSLRSDMPSVQDIVEGTRLMAMKTVESVSDNTATWRIHCATEIPLMWNLYYLKPGTMSPQVVQTPQLWIMTPGQTTDWIKYCESSSLISNFDWHPRFGVTFYDSTTTIDHFGCMMDLHNVNQFTVEQLDQIHKVCLYSELNSFTIR